MAYEVFLDGVLLPITPSKITTKVKNQNKTIKLINDGEVNILKAAGLTEISFKVLIPQILYPFANYEAGFKKANYFTDKFKKLKNKKEPFQFICSRVSPNGNLLFDTNIKVSLEDYTIIEDVKNGLDLMVSVKLKQYREYGTKILSVQKAEANAFLGPAVVTIKEKRSAETSPTPKVKPKIHKVITGDTLWGIAKKYYGDGSKYSKIFDSNREKIKNPNLIYDGDTLIIPI